MLILRLVLLFSVILLPSVSAAAGKVLLLELEGVIGPASRDFVLKGIARAEREQADLLVLRMNTPGGLDISMRDIIQAILSSKVPVATYVAPAGARAASAGTYILYASHIAAMAPATNLGAATPVQIGGGLPDLSGGDDAGEPDDSGAKDGKNKDDRDNAGDAGAGSETEKLQPAAKPGTANAPKTAMERKIINDARAYIRSLAQLRGRNIAWAEQAVQDAASLSAGEALKENVIDLVAASVAELIEKSNGRTVEIDGRQQVIALDDPLIEIVEPDWRNQLLAIITHPQIAYILMLLGIYGLFFELANPGTVIPGVLGGICLLLALFAFQVLPVNYAGLALIILGMCFMIAEAFLPSFGALGIGGVVAFVTGSLILWDEEQTGYALPVSLIAGFAIASVLLILVLGTMAVRNRRRPVVSGDAILIGHTGIALEDFAGDEKGHIRLFGEIWSARSEQPVTQGQTVRVATRNGLLLTVHPEEKI
jgi:membrane-bound serine protease (ClpP class)